MPKYRYFTQDLLTGEDFGDIELYGVYAQRQLSTQGQFTGTVKLTDDGLNALRLQCTQPGRTALYMERNDEVIWGGMLWSRTYSTASHACELSALTWESYFDHVIMQNDFVQQNVDQALIFQAMCTALKADPTIDIGLTLQTPLPAASVPRTVLIPGYEFHFATDVITSLIGVDQGLEYTIDPDKTIRLGYPQIGADNPNLVFDYPGQILSYYMPESGAKSGAKFAALGYGTGNQVARAVATAQSTLNAGYPGWWVVNQYSTIADQNTLANKATADAFKYNMPYSVPTFQLKPDAIVDFNAWNNLGDTFTAYIDDLRYPDGKTIQSRMIGWELTPMSADSAEVLQLTIDGADAA